jgi:hypothetical protein
MLLICPTRQAEYFSRDDWTSGIALNGFAKLASTRGGFYALRVVRSHAERKKTDQDA